MGSFYATCSASNISICNGDEMYVQLLVPTWRDHFHNGYCIEPYKSNNGPNAYEHGLRVSNDGSQAEFSPFGFPLFGTYDDYGNIKLNDKNHPNVKMLEEFFNLNIYQIINCAQDDRWYKYWYKPQFIDKTKEEYTGQWKNWKVSDDLKNPEVLLKLTLTYFSKPAYEFLTDKLDVGDSWWQAQVEKQYSELKKNLQDLINVKNQKKSVKGFDEIDQDILDAMRKMYADKSFTDDELKQKYVDMNAGISKYSLRTYTDKFYIHHIVNHNMFELLNITESNLQDIIDQRNLIFNLTGMYKTLIPSNYGSQQSNYDQIGKFLTHMADYANVKANQELTERMEWELEEAIDWYENEITDEKRKELTSSFDEEPTEEEIYALYKEFAYNE